MTVNTPPPLSSSPFPCPASASPYITKRTVLLFRQPRLRFFGDNLRARRPDVEAGRRLSAGLGDRRDMLHFLPEGAKGATGVRAALL